MVPEIRSATDRISLPSPFNPPPPKSPKNDNIKNEKNPGDIIILHKCTKNYDHPLYCSRDMTHD